MAASNIVTFDEMKDIENNPNYLIIDVREPKELESTGKIGGSINIPVGDLKSILEKSTDEEFQEKYGRPKPASDFPLIFSCRLGGRAAKAEAIAKSLGFINAKCYKGSWAEWSEKIGESK